MQCVAFLRATIIVVLLAWSPLWAAPLQWPISDAQLVQTREEIRHHLSATDLTHVASVRLTSPHQLRHLYQQHDYEPLWIEKVGILLEAAELLEVLKRAGTEGLPLQDYPLVLLEQYLFGAIDSPTELAKLDLLLTDSFLEYSRNVRSGRVKPRRFSEEWLFPITTFDGSSLLLSAMQHHNLGEALASLPPQQEGYRKLRTLLQYYRTIAEQGGWPTVNGSETLQRGTQGQEVVKLRERLRLSGDLFGMVNDPELFDGNLEKAVEGFQLRHGLVADGRVGRRTRTALNLPVEARISQIEANMERWRWLPRELPSRYIMVNLAGYDLQVVDAQRVVMSMRVIVGRDYRQTPAFASEVTLLVLNPHWYVPRRIFLEDILPQLQRNPRKLARLRMDVLDGERVVETETIDWARVNSSNFPYTLRQQPGPDNALGRIKFQLRDGNGIYLHDTPDRHLFERPARAFSSGCIRLEQPLALAEYLLADPEQWNAHKLEEVIASGTPVGLRLPVAVPILFTYWTAWVDQDGVLQFRQDVYDRDRRLVRLWEKTAT